MANIFDELSESLDRLVGSPVADYPGAEMYIQRRLDTIREHAARTGREPDNGLDWEGISQEVSSTFPGVDPEYFRDHYAVGRGMATRSGRVEQYRRGNSGSGPTATEVFGTVPFIGAGINALRNYGASQGFERIQDGTADEADYEFVGRMQAGQQTQAQRGMLGRVVSGASQVPAYGIEMAGTGPVFTGARRGASMLMGRVAAASPLTRAAAFGVGATAQTAANPGRVAEAITRRMMPGELGGRGETFGQAAGPGFADAAIETASEYASGLLPRRVANFGQGFMPTSVQRLMRQANISGIPGEYFEERIGEIARGMTGIATTPEGSPDFGLIGSFLEGDFRRFLEDSAVEVGTFAVPGATGAAANFRQWSQFRGMPSSGGPRIRIVPELGPAATPEDERRHAAVSQRAEERNAREVQRWLTSAPVEELERWAQWEPVTRYVPMEAVLRFAEARRQAEQDMARQTQQQADDGEREQINQRLSGLQEMAREYANGILDGLREESRGSNQAATAVEPQHVAAENRAFPPAVQPSPMGESANPRQNFGVARPIPSEMLPSPVRGAMADGGFDSVRTRGMEDAGGFDPVRGPSLRGQDRVLPTGPIPIPARSADDKILARTEPESRIDEQQQSPTLQQLPQSYANIISNRPQEAKIPQAAREAANIDAEATTLPPAPAARPAEVEPSPRTQPKPQESPSAESTLDQGDVHPDILLARTGQRDALIEQELARFRKMGGAYKSTSRDDMRSRAALELVEAAQKYVEAAKKPGFNLPFKTYAYRIVRRGLLEETGGVIAPGRDMKYTIAAYRRAEQALAASQGRNPQFSEVFAEVNADRRRRGQKPLTERQGKNLREAMAVERTSTGQSQESGSGDELAPMIERVPAREDLWSSAKRAEGAEAVARVKQLLKDFPDRSAASVATRAFGLEGDPQNLNEISKRTGQSWSAANSRLMAAIEHLVANTTGELVEMRIGKQTHQVPQEVYDAVEWSIREHLGKQLRDADKAKREPTARSQQHDTIFELIRRQKIRRGTAINDYAEEFSQHDILRDLITSDSKAVSIEAWVDSLVERGLLSVPKDRDGVNYLVEILIGAASRAEKTETANEHSRSVQEQGNQDSGQREAGGASPEGAKAGGSPGADPGEAQGGGSPAQNQIAAAPQEANEPSAESQVQKPAVKDAETAQTILAVRRHHSTDNMLDEAVYNMGLDDGRTPTRRDAAGYLADSWDNARKEELPTRALEDAMLAIGMAKIPEGESTTFDGRIHATSSPVRFGDRVIVAIPGWSLDGAIVRKPRVDPVGLSPQSPQEANEPSAKANEIEPVMVGPDGSLKPRSINAQLLGESAGESTQVQPRIDTASKELARIEALAAKNEELAAIVGEEPLTTPFTPRNPGETDETYAKRYLAWLDNQISTSDITYDTIEDGVSKAMLPLKMADMVRVADGVGVWAQNLSKQEITKAIIRKFSGIRASYERNSGRDRLTVRQNRDEYERLRRQLQESTATQVQPAKPSKALSTVRATDALAKIESALKAAKLAQSGDAMEVVVKEMDDAYRDLPKDEFIELTRAFSLIPGWKGSKPQALKFLKDLADRIERNFYSMPVYRGILAKLGINEQFHGVSQDDPYVDKIRSAIADIPVPILQFLAIRGYDVVYYDGKAVTPKKPNLANPGTGGFHSSQDQFTSENDTLFNIGFNKATHTDNAGATVAHEIGHAVHAALTFDGFGPFVDRLIGDTSVASSAIEEASRRTGKKMSSEWKQYALHNTEIVAEVFAEIVWRKKTGANSVQKRWMVSFSKIFPDLAKFLEKQIPILREVSVLNPNRWMVEPVPGDLAAMPVGDTRFDTPVSQSVPRDGEGKVITEGLSEHAIVETMMREFGQAWYHPDHSMVEYALYRYRPEAIMVDQLNAGHIGIAAHETAHGLDKDNRIVDRMPTVVRTVIATMSYDPSIKGNALAAAREGFSELVRVTLTGDTRVSVPKAVRQWWYSWRQQNPEIDAKLNRIKGLVDQYRRQGPVARTIGRIVDTREYPRAIMSRMERAQDIVLNAWDKFQERFVDRFRALSKFDELVAKRRGHQNDLGIYEIALAAQGTAPTLAAEAITRGVLTFRKGKHGWETSRISEPLMDVFQFLRDEGFGEDEFVAYAISKQVLTDNEKETISVPPHEVEDARGVLQEVAKSRAKQAVFDRTLARWTAFSNAILQVSVDTGKITQETADRFKEEFPYYIPTFRVGHEISSETGEADSSSNPLMKRSGSGLPRYNPVQATLETLQMAYQSAHEQMLGDTLWNAAQDIEGTGKFVVEERMHMDRPVEVDTKRIKRALIAIGYDPNLVNGPDSTLQFFMPQFFYDGSHPVMTIMVDGKPKHLRFVGDQGADLYRALGRINDIELLHPVIKVFSLMTASVRAGATVLNPAFALIRNPIRDIQHYLMTSKKVKGLEQFTGLGVWFAKNLVSTISGLAGRQKAEIVELFDAMGGRMQQHFGVDPGSIHQTRRRLMGTRTRHDKAKGIFGEIYEAATAVLAIPEGAPRLAEFHNVLNGYGVTDQAIGEYFAGKGSLPVVALYRAINAAADVTVNFKKRGALGKGLTAVFPYLNARIQGLDKWIRNIKDDPRRAMLAFSIMVAIYLRYLEGTPPEEEDLDEARRDLNWNFFDENGRLETSVPMAPEWAASLMPIGALWRYLRRERPQAIGSLLWRMGMEFQPVGMPSGTPILEAMVNRNFRTGRPIVPEWIAQNRIPEDQVGPGTLPAYQWAGEQLGVSPARLQHAASGLTGGLATGQGIDPNRLTLGTRDEQVRTIAEFSRRAARAKQEIGSERRANRPLTDQDRAEAARLVAIDDLLGDLRKPGYQTQDRDKRWETERWATGLARFAQGLPETTAYPNPLRSTSSPEMPDTVRQAVTDFLRRQAAAAARPMPVRAPKGSTIESTVRNWEASRGGAAAIFHSLGLTGGESIREFVRQATSPPQLRPSEPATP